jgi:uncharacterized membrane protein
MKLEPKAGRAVEEARSRLERYDPFLAPQLVLAGAIALDFALPKRLTIGPTWLLPALETLALLGLVAASPHPRMRQSPLRRRVAISLTGLVSVANIISLVELCSHLLRGNVSDGRRLIASGILLWVTNVLLFGIWYWELDRGGPVDRAANSEAYPDFLFPQMTDPRFAPTDWHPGTLDYLYVSLTNASAFSPTDTMPLTGSAKLLMGAQGMTALATIGLVFARAVNIL